MDDHRGKKETCRTGGEISRRDFLKTSGIVVIGVGSAVVSFRVALQLRKDIFLLIPRSARVA